MKTGDWSQSQLVRVEGGIRETTGANGLKITKLFHYKGVKHNICTYSQEIDGYKSCRGYIVVEQNYVVENLQLMQNTQRSIN